jgi:uncharacterized damage-inducible protein DinB
MNILDRLLGHDAWTTRQLLLRCRELTDDQLDRPFDIGDRSLRQTFDHLIGCMESHTDLMLQRPLTVAYREDRSVEGMLVRLKLVAQDFAEFAVRVEQEGRAEERVPNLAGTRKLPLGSVIAHLITHSMHHRAQIMFILGQLGIQDVIEGDALGWEGQARGWGYDWCDSYGRVIAG